MKHLSAALVLLLLLAIGAPAVAQEKPEPVIVALHLKDGTVLIGEILSEDGGKIRFRSQTLGEVTVAADDVEARGPGAATPEPVHAAAPPAPVTHTKVPTWTRTLTAGGTWVSPPYTQGQLAGAPAGVTGAALHLPGRQFSAQVGASATHTSHDDSVSLSASVTYVDNEPSGRLSEAFSVDLEYSRLLTPRTYVVSRTTFRRDAARNIDNSFAELAGFGVKAIEHPRLRADIVLGGAVLRENKNTRFDDRFEPQLGVMEAFVVTLTPRALFSHRLVYRAGVRESEVWSIESYSGFQGALTSRLSFTAGLTWNYDNILGDAVTPLPAGALFPGSPALALLANRRTVRQFTSGLQFSF
jgi:hypothetical protein